MALSYQYASAALHAYEIGYGYAYAVKTAYMANSTIKDDAAISINMFSFP